MPRPRARDPRCKIVAVRFRPDEAVRLDRAASSAGQTVSDYIRTAALTDRPAHGIPALERHDLSRLALLLSRGGDVPRILEQLRILIGKIDELV